MTFLNQNPFFRVLLPFTLGISFWLLGYEKAPQIAVPCTDYLLAFIAWLTMLKKTKEVPKVIFGVLSQAFLLLAGWGLCQYHNQKENPQHYTHLLSSEPEYFAGYISDLPAQKAKTIKAEVILQRTKVKGKWQSTEGKIIVYFQKSAAAAAVEPGITIVFSAPLKEVQPPLNPHEFDYKKYLERKNIFYTTYLDTFSWSSVQKIKTFSVYGLAQKIRQSLLQTYKASGLQQDEFALVSALVLGYDDEIDQPLMQAYSHTGTIHVLSVSGLHVGIIYLALGFIFSFLQHNKKLRWLRVMLILSILWFFVLLSGFSPPAVRAALMFSLILFGKTYFENTETANIVFVSAFISLCYNPFWLADVGFQLSYTAVLGIVWLYPYFYNLFTFSWGWADKVWSLCSVSLAAQLATLPLTLYYFHQFPTLFLITNLIIIPISTVLMYAGMFLLFFAKIAFVNKALVGLTSLLVKCMNGLALFFDGLSFGTIDNIHLSLTNMFLLYLLIILVFFAIERRSFKLLTSSFMLACLMLCISIGADLQNKKTNELVVYHADKSAVVTVFNGNSCLQLTDTLPDDRLRSALRENKIYHDLAHEDQRSLSKVSLIYIDGKKILFAKDGALITKALVAAVSPDHIWLPAYAVKRYKQRKALCNEKNLLISGRFYKKEGCMDGAYYTQDKGAFVLSLH